ncbi:MAG: hypothetical protein PHW32_01320 [Bacilli bacterium]|nr:hypothetical protein [Bacilli bacterium]MDD4282349.1 hypothetical protein [Bacilli bacterium]MDD4718464.1 hypothetical protein [Bacilli bacterium]
MKKDKLNWSKVWSKKYPILDNYHNMENIIKYQKQIKDMYSEFLKEYNISNQDTVLIIKDILYKEYLSRKD